MFDAIISAHSYYYLHLQFAIADDESVLNSKDIEWSNENLLEMSSLEEDSIEPPRKVARPDKVATIMISLTIIPRARVRYEVIDSQRGPKRRVGYNHLISNKREWNNCFIKNHQQILPDFADFAWLEQPEGNLRWL